MDGDLYFVGVEEGEGGGAFEECKKRGFTSAQSDGGWEDEQWGRFIAEREWMDECQFLREGEDCRRGTRGPNILNYETPEYHIITLARDGMDNFVQQSGLEPELQALVKKSVAIVNASGSVDDECAPLTMTLKARVYSFATPRSVERDELGWRTMFLAYLEHGKAPPPSSRNASDLGPLAASLPCPARRTSRSAKAARGAKASSRPRQGRKRGRAGEDVAGEEEGEAVGSEGEGEPAGSRGGVGEEEGGDEAGQEGSGGAGTRTSVMGQGEKWVMSEAELGMVRDHLLAGSPLERDLSGSELLELLLAAGGIACGKVGEQEVGKPMYGRSFIEHHKRRLGGPPSSRAAGGAASQAVSEQSEGEEGAAGQQQQQQQQQQQGGPTHRRGQSGGVGGDGGGCNGVLGPGAHASHMGWHAGAAAAELAHGVLNGVMHGKPPLGRRRPSVDGSLAGAGRGEGGPPLGCWQPGGLGMPLGGPPGLGCFSLTPLNQTLPTGSHPPPLNLRVCQGGTDSSRGEALDPGVTTSAPPPPWASLAHNPAWALSSGAGGPGAGAGGPSASAPLGAPWAGPVGASRRKGGRTSGPGHLRPATPQPPHLTPPKLVQHNSAPITLGGEGAQQQQQQQQQQGGPMAQEQVLLGSLPPAQGLPLITQSMQQQLEQQQQRLLQSVQLAQALALGPPLPGSSADLARCGPPAAAAAAAAVAAICGSQGLGLPTPGLLWPSSGTGGAVVSSGVQGWTGQGLKSHAQQLPGLPARGLEGPPTITTGAGRALTQTGRQAPPAIQWTGGKPTAAVGGGPAGGAAAAAAAAAGGGAAAGVQGGMAGVLASLPPGLHMSMLAGRPWSLPGMGMGSHMGMQAGPDQAGMLPGGGVPGPNLAACLQLSGLAGAGAAGVAGGQPLAPPQLKS
ncbi:hypothetical protein V8C86DRAFT_3146491 [Haematococcus lacustris]